MNVVSCGSRQPWLLQEHGKLILGQMTRPRSRKAGASLNDKNICGVAELRWKNIGDHRCINAQPWVLKKNISSDIIYNPNIPQVYPTMVNMTTQEDISPAPAKIPLGSIDVPSMIHRIVFWQICHPWLEVSGVSFSNGGTPKSPFKTRPWLLMTWNQNETSDSSGSWKRKSCLADPRHPLIQP